FFFSAPWLFWQMWLFISPALRKKEKRLVLPFVAGTSLLMMCGMLFAYFYVLPLTFRFFFEFNRDYHNIVTVSSIWNFELMMIVAVGLSFETPVIILFLNLLRIVNIKILLKNLRWAILLAFVVSAIITPSGDPFTQTVVAVPIVALYLLGIAMSAFFPPKKIEE
ncbi:MAG: twin-arginine translocase subunit TatC, partial [Acidobacteria bacterium]|nr:twin-arginine translocase subunit TatC [Acidobacteriota bacterium]